LFSPTGKTSIANWGCKYRGKSCNFSPQSPAFLYQENDFFLLCHAT